MRPDAIRQVREGLEHYEQQTEEEEVAEDEASYDAPAQTVMQVPSELGPTCGD